MKDEADFLICFRKFSLLKKIKTKAKWNYQVLVETYVC